MDVVYLMLAVGFFAATRALIKLCTQV